MQFYAALFISIIKMFMYALWVLFTEVKRCQIILVSSTPKYSVYVRIAMINKYQVHIYTNVTSIQWLL